MSVAGENPACRAIIKCNTITVKLLFICASVEPYKDGVGDYSVKLASQLNRDGWKTAIVALRDKHCNTAEESEATAGTPALRLPATMSFQHRLRHLAGYVKAFQPDWISLQYVPYGFSANGTPLLLSRGLAGLKGNFRWHLMVHEVCVGKGLNWKMNIVNFLQEYSLKKLMARLEPVVHTTTPKYRALLAETGIKAELLPLFGNIDVSSAPEDGSNTTLKGVYFGIVPEESSQHFFAAGIGKYCVDNSRRLEIIFCGRSGRNVDSFINLIRSYCPDEILKISRTGELRPEDLSRQFSAADFGICRVRPELVGKSGSAIAMLEHGLPLWIPLKGGAIDEATVYRPELCFTELNQVDTITRKSPKPRIQIVADIFKKALLKTSAGK